MAMDVQRVDVWAAGMTDRPGALAEKLDALSTAGADLGFVIARRAPEDPGQGVVFVTPIKGVKQIRAAEAAGFMKTSSLHSLRVQAPDRAGLGAKMTAALAEAGVNLRGLSAAAVGKQCVVHLAFDESEDATKAGRILRKL